MNDLTFKLMREKNILRCESPRKEDNHPLLPVGFGHTLTSWSVAEWGNAAGGECGEAQNIAKKMLRFRDNIAGNTKKSREEYKEDLASEIAGCLIYLDLWAASEGINLEQAIRDEFNKKSLEIGSEIKL